MQLPHSDLVSTAPTVYEGEVSLGFSKLCIMWSCKDMSCDAEAAGFQFPRVNSRDTVLTYKV